MARFWEMKENGAGEHEGSSLCSIRWKKSKREPFCRPLETEFSRRVAPLRKRNERMWANEIHVQVPKHSWQFPRVIGSWLRGVFYPYDEVTRRTCPPHEMHRGCRLVPTALFNESASERQTSGTLLIRETCFPPPRFYRNAFIIDYSERYLSQCNFLHAR